MIDAKSTEIAEWHALVVEAEQRCDIVLDEDLQHYLSSLLILSVRKSELAMQPVGYNLLNAYQTCRTQQLSLLRDVGDERRHAMAETFKRLSHEFGCLVDVLHSMRDYSQSKTVLIQAMDLWQLTGSRRSLSLLKNATTQQSNPLKVS